MAERYTRLFTAPPNIYAEGAPIIFSAGALLRDNLNGGVLVQLKIKNIPDKIIKAVKISIMSIDSAGRVFEGTRKFEYLDLSAADDFFRSPFALEQFTKIPGKCGTVKMPVPQLCCRNFPGTSDVGTENYRFSLRIKNFFLMIHITMTAGGCPFPAYRIYHPLLLPVCREFINGLPGDFRAIMIQPFRQQLYFAHRQHH